MTVRGPHEFLGNAPLNWNRIARALDFYRSLSFVYVEVPWVVPPEVTQATIPKEGAGLPYELTRGGDLVGSAEQSLLWLTKLGTLKSERFEPKYVAISPCFRDEERTSLHQKTFMKVELFYPTKNPETPLRLLGNARRFFQEEGLETEIRETEIGYDLYGNGIEVGSYGFRTWEGISWAYGTGLAEPRTTQALFAGVKKPERT